MTPSAPKPLSNNPDDFIAGGSLYPGGTGLIEDIAYVLWDYEGKMPPNSVVAVKCIFKPTDGSNDGKDVLIFWSVGPSTEFVPSQDGGFIFPVGNAQGIKNSTNWFHVTAALRDTCGLEGAKLNGAAGIRCLISGQLTLVRKDQPTRDGLVPQQATPGQPTYKSTFLIPTSAIFPWDRQAGGRAVRPAAAAKPGPVAVPAPAAAPVAHAPAPVPMPTAAAPAVSNGVVPTDTSALIAEVVYEVLTQVEGNAITLKDLPKAMLDKIGPQGRGIAVPTRTAISKQIKDVAFITALAEANGWAFDPATNVLSV